MRKLFPVLTLLMFSLAGFWTAITINSQNISLPLQLPARQDEGCVSNPADDFVQEITGTVDGDELVARVSARFGGAVDSLTWRGKEFINVFDHGRQISYAWQMDGYGECFNPTEPGSASDLFSYSSTTEVLQVCSPASNVLTTQIHPAYWLAPGETGFCDRADTAFNDTLVSDQTFTKTIEIGYEGIENVIAFTGEIEIPQDYQFLQLEMPTGYLTYEFINYFRFDPGTVELQVAESQELVAPWSFVNVSQLPPILATQDGEYAMGAFSPDQPTAYEILMYDVPNPADRTNKWNIVFHEKPAPAGTYTYRSFVVVGTLEQVKAGLQQLIELFPTDVSPPEGYIDVSNCDIIGGWVWDPKTPNLPIEVEFRLVNEDGSETSLLTVNANRYRSDLAEALSDNGNHAFNVSTAQLINSGEPQTLRVYGLNSNPRLPASLLIPNELTLTCPGLAPTEAQPTSITARAGSASSSDNENGGGGGGFNLPCPNGTIPLIFGAAFFFSRKRNSKPTESEQNG